MSTAEFSVHAQVAVITLAHPPVNSLGHALRHAIVAGIERAQADSSVQAVVLRGAGNAFCGGADIREFNTPAASARPNTREVIAAVEGCGKPVIAAIHQVAMGGGLELALGCHYRIAAPDAQLALPEVRLGLLPGAGGTQRLPRAIGLAAALEMMLSGEPVAAERAPAGLVDELVIGDLLAGALTFARKVLARMRPSPKLRDLPVKHDGDIGAFFGAARARVAKEARGFPAPPKIIDCVEAATVLAFDEGTKFERARFEELVASIESKALRHAFFAERAAAKIPGLPEATRTRPIARVAVIGAGTMGGGIAMVFANAGFPVTLVDLNQQALERGLDTVRKNYAASRAKGRMSQRDMDERLARLAPSLSYDAVTDADLTVEAVFEDMAVKEQVFRRLDQLAKGGAILATNTSTLDVNRIASFTRRPEDVLGLHFFSPAHIMRLLEVVRAERTSAEVLATAMQLAKTLKKVGVVAGVCDGFIGNRMLEQYLRQAYFVVEEGAAPQQVDQALQAWGMAMGPFAMMDMAGQDVGWRIRQRRHADHPAETYAPWIDRVCELGRYGQKTGKGVYRYESGSRTPVPDAEIEALISDSARAAGVQRRAVTDEEIVERCVYALVNEGARILDEGMALRASDIDVVYLTGYGFPRYRGGPMFYADTVGLSNIVAAMHRYAGGRHGQHWQPADLLARSASAGKKFSA